MEKRKVRGPWKKSSNTLTDGLRWSSFALLLAAGIINAIGVTMFLAPVHLYDSGISGTSMLLWQITPERYTLSLFLLLLNTPLLSVRLAEAGHGLYGVLPLGGAGVLRRIVSHYQRPPYRRFHCLALCGEGSAAVRPVRRADFRHRQRYDHRFGGAIDGVEVMAVIFAKGLGLTVGTFVMIYNVLLYIAIGCIFKSWVLPLYSIVTYCVAIKAVDFIVEGLDKAKSAMIVTNQETAISAALSEAFAGASPTLTPEAFTPDRSRPSSTL